MPFLRIQVNTVLTPGQAKTLAARASTVVAGQLGKPERYVMVSVEHNPAMQFAGTDAPLAYLELKSIGLPESVTADASRVLCELVSDATAIDPERIYIEFTDAPRRMWGWNGGTF
ncbi:MAG: phenylpyruvate tautomerase MIF-related protein [Pseudomonadota bacterium]